MRVSIDHQRIERGILFKKIYHAVLVRVVFTEVEKQIIKDNDQNYAVIVERDPPADVKKPYHDQSIYYLTVAKLLDGLSDHYLCATPAEAKHYEALVLASLKNFKEFLEQNTEAPQSGVYEL